MFGGINMNMETEMEWNSHMMKSGRVFGTYDFMISKGHTLAEMNYVIWDVEDNSYMPLVKAVAVTLDTHPDILLKDVGPMRTAVEEQQANQMNTRLDQERNPQMNDDGTEDTNAPYYPQAGPTGRELTQGGKPIQGAFQGIKNFFTGGRSSRGANARDVDAQAPGSQEEAKDRYGKLTQLNPFSTGRAWLDSRTDKRDRGIAAASRQNAFEAKTRMLEGRRIDELSPQELAEYDRNEELMESGDNVTGDSTYTRPLQDRKKDRQNADWHRDANNPLRKPNMPFPIRGAKVVAEAKLRGEGQEDRRQDRLRRRGDELPLTDEQVDEVDGIDDRQGNESTAAREAADTDTPLEEDEQFDTETPISEPSTDKPTEETGGKPQATEAEEATGDEEPAWYAALPFKRGHTSHKNWVSAIKANMDEDGTVDEAGLRAAVKTFRGTKAGKDAEGNPTPKVPKEEVIQAVLATFPGTKREDVEQIVEEEAGDEGEKRSAKDIVADAKEKYDKENKKPAEEAPAEEEFDTGDGGKEEEEEFEIDDDVPFDRNTNKVLQSSDAINSAWDYLSLLKGR